MFQTQDRETINSTSKVAVSFKIIMTTSVTRPCFTTQRQTCKAARPIKRPIFFGLRLVLHKTDGHKPHHCGQLLKCEDIETQKGRGLMGRDEYTSQPIER